MGRSPAVRCEARFRGRVQGVGFRHTTTIVAKRFPVVGYVSNVRDGSVRLVVEGDRESVSSMIQAMGEAMPGHIQDVEQAWSPPTGEFRGFEVRYEP